MRPLLYRKWVRWIWHQGVTLRHKCHWTDTETEIRETLQQKCGRDRDGTEEEMKLGPRQWDWDWDRSWKSKNNPLYLTSLSQSLNTYWLANLFIYKQITLVNLQPEKVQTIAHTPVPVPPSSPHNCSADRDKITRRDSLETAVPWSDVKLRYDFQLLAQLSHSHNSIHSPSSLSHT